MNCFDGHRIYNGCPDSTLKSKLDQDEKEIIRLKNLIKSLDDGISVTYFPGYPDHGYMSFKGHKVLIDQFYDTRIEALAAVLKKLQNDQI